MAPEVPQSPESLSSTSENLFGLSENVTKWLSTMMDSISKMFDNPDNNSLLGSVIGFFNSFIGKKEEEKTNGGEGKSESTVAKVAPSRPQDQQVDDVSMPETPPEKATPAARVTMADVPSEIPQIKDIETFNNLYKTKGLSAVLDSETGKYILTYSKYQQYSWNKQARKWDVKITTAKFTCDKLPDLQGIPDGLIAHEIRRQAVAYQLLGERYVHHPSFIEQTPYGFTPPEPRGPHIQRVLFISDTHQHNISPFLANLEDQYNPDIFVHGGDFNGHSSALTHVSSTPFIGVLGNHDRHEEEQLGAFPLSDAVQSNIKKGPGCYAYEQSGITYFMMDYPKYQKGKGYSMSQEQLDFFDRVTRESSGPVFFTCHFPLIQDSYGIGIGQPGYEQTVGGYQDLLAIANRNLTSRGLAFYPIAGHTHNPHVVGNMINVGASGGHYNEASNHDHAFVVTVADVNKNTGKIEGLYFMNSDGTPISPDLHQSIWGNTPKRPIAIPTVG